MKIIKVSVVLSLALFFFTAIIYPSFSTDSWAYYELSNSLLNLNYKTLNVRQYSLQTESSISFPFFYPLVLMLVGSLVPLDIYNGIITNIVIVILITMTLKKILSLTSENEKLFIVLSSLIFNIGFLYELISARSIPLALLLTILTFYCLARGGRNYILAAGVTAALGCATRFDLIPFYFVVSIYLLISNFRDGSKFALLALFGVMSWVVYSYLNFNLPFVTENSVILEQVTDKADVLLFEYPINKSFFDLVTLVTKRLFPGFFVILGLFVTALYLYRRHKGSCCLNDLNLCFVCASLFSLIFVLLTGYTDIRYYAIASVYFVLLLSKQINVNKKFNCYIGMLIVFFICLLTSARVYKNYFYENVYVRDNVYECFNKNETYLIADGIRGRVLSAQLSAERAVKTVMSPSDIDVIDLNAFVSKFNVSYIAIHDSYEDELNFNGHMDYNCGNFLFYGVNESDTK